MTRTSQRIRFLLDHRWSPRHMSEYIDDELTPEGRLRIDRHLHDCRRCRELLLGLRRMLAGLRRQEDAAEPRVAPAVLAQVRRRIEEEGSDAGGV